MLTLLYLPWVLPPSLPELREAVKASLPAFCAPRNVVAVSSLPRTALGKLQRHLLALDESGTDG